MVTPHPQLSGDGIPELYLAFDICETETDDSSDDDMEWQNQIEGRTEFKSNHNTVKKYGDTIYSDTDDDKRGTISTHSAGSGTDASSTEADTDYERKPTSFLKQRKFRMADYYMPTHSIHTSRGSSFLSSNRSNYISKYTERGYGEGSDTAAADAQNEK